MDNMKQTKQYQFSYLPYKNFKSFSLNFFEKNSTCHQSRKGWNQLALSHHLLAPGYHTQVSLYVDESLTRAQKGKDWVDLSKSGHDQASELLLT